MQEFQFNADGPQFQNPYGGFYNQAASLSSSRIWYAALVPIIALYVELYASNLYLGILVWSCALISIWIACALDKKYLGENGIDTSRIGAAYIIFAPFYISKRSKLLRQKSSAAAVMTVALLYALVSNGFTDALTMEESDMIDQVKYNYSVYIDGLSGYDSYNYIGESLVDWSGLTEDDFEWSAVRKSGCIEVYAESQVICVVFSVEYDGYAFGDITVESLNIDGEEYGGGELSEKLAEIFIGEEESGDEEESSDGVRDNRSDSYDSYTEA